jgi:pimeloyl-ACP methyl ester carboxylesterase
MWGDRQSQPLLLIHGGLDHCRSWDPVAQALSDRYAVYAPDLRGHGDSQWATGGQYEIKEWVLDIAALVDALQPPVTIIGHSRGGTVALYYAGIFPERVAKVISVEGLGMTMPQHQVDGDEPAHRRIGRWIKQIRDMEQRRPHRYRSLDEAVNRMMAANRRLTREMARHLALHGTRSNADGTCSWKFDNYTRNYSFDFREAQEVWANISAPVLLISGSESSLSGDTWQRRADAIPAFRSVVVEGAGHWVQHDRLATFLQVVDEFLAEQHH